MAAELKLEPFTDESAQPAVRGSLHHPAYPTGPGLVLTHGAGGNCQMLLLLALAEEFSRLGWFVLRCNLPFRQARPHGPPSSASAVRDREGLCRAEDPQIAHALLLTSYPLHPPGKPAQLRVQHFPQLKIPALFVVGTRDPFATVEELESARKLIPAATAVVVVEGAGHDLGYGRKKAGVDLPARVRKSFTALLETALIKS
jgi:hypothetical protein